jgi:hypothetical protein
MTEESTEANPLFVELIFQLQGAAWIHMGKVANPATGKIDRDLDMARGAIDMLGMIEAKTRGNLVADEEHLLRELLTQVRLNFASEKKKPDATESDASDAADAATASKEASTDVEDSPES